MPTREQMKAEKERLAREAWEKEREAIRNRKGVTQYAEKFGISAQTFNFLLMQQGRMEGEPGYFHATAAYKKYEHGVQKGHGYSYDPEFFEGLDTSSVALHSAEEDRKAHRAAKKTPQISTMPTWGQPVRQQKTGLISALTGLFKH